MEVLAPGTCGLFGRIGHDPEHRGVAAIVSTATAVTDGATPRTGRTDRTRRRRGAGIDDPVGMYLEQIGRHPGGQSMCAERAQGHTQAAQQAGENKECAKHMRKSSRYWILEKQKQATDGHR